MAITIDELRLADDAQRWASFGFELEAETCRLGAVTLRFLGREAGEGILSWSLAGLHSTELDGLATEVGREPAQACAVPHPNGVLGIDHIVVVAPDFERSVDALKLAGLDLRRIREEPTPAGAPRQAFFRLGREILEVVAEPAEAVERRGGGQRAAHFWGLALACADVAGTAARFGGHVSSVRDAVQPGRQIASVRRSAGLGVPVALISAARERGPA
jgi:hypothetical protein